MVEHFNKLTPAEAERLAMLAEEFGECLQVIGKILRHGYESYNPFDINGTTNRDLLERELSDVLYCMDLLEQGEDIDIDYVNRLLANKHNKPNPYLHHQS